MTSRSTALAWSLVAAVAAALATGVVAGWLTGRLDDDPRSWTVALIFTLLGVRFATHSPVNPVGWLMLLIGLAAALGVLTATGSSIPIVAWIGSWIWLPAYTTLPALILLFPTGRPVSPRWWPAIGLVGAGTVGMAVGLAAASWRSPTTFWDDAVAQRIARGWDTVLVAAGLAAVAIGLVAGVVSLAVRWWRGPDQRPMLAWAMACGLLTGVAGILEAAVASSFWSLAALAVPAAAVLAVVRYGLFDMTLVIHRSLLYAALSLTLLALYAAVAWAGASIVPEQAEAVAAVAVALTVLPLRTLVQRRIDRWLYGDRSQPYAALAGLSHRLEGALGVDEVLPAIAEQVAGALNAPYVRAAVDTDSPRGTVEVGRSRGWPAVSFR